MAALQLRNHIPISKPLTGASRSTAVRRRYTTLWASSRPGITSAVGWTSQSAGTPTPVYRHDTLVVMKAKLHTLFPEGGMTGCNAHGRYVGTVSGVYGALVVPLAMGLHAAICPRPLAGDHRQAGAQSARGVGHTRRPGRALAGPCMRRHPSRQMDIIESKSGSKARAGKIHGYLSWQGVLNNAFNVCGGERIFLDMSRVA